MMREYVLQWENAMSCGMPEDPPKILITMLHEQACERQEKALRKASIPLKRAETAAPPPASTTASASKSTKAVVNLSGKEEGGEGI